MFNKIICRLQDLDRQTKDVFSKMSHSMIVKILGLIARFFVSIFIGRTLGPEGLGNVNLINQIVTILMVFSILGLDNVLVKNISIGRNTKNYNNIRNSVYTSIIISLISSTTIILIGVLSAKYLATHIFESEALYVPLLIVFLSMLPQTLGRVYTSCINGFLKIWQSNLLKEALTSLIVALGLVIYWIIGVQLNLINIILLYAIGKLVTFLSSYVYWNRLVKFKKGALKYDSSIIKQSIPLLLVSSMAVISTSTDVVMLGWLSDSSEVGLYTVASRLALFVLFFLQVSNSVLSPKIASFYANNNKVELETMIQRVTLFLTIIGLGFLLFFILLGKPILGFWGLAFKESYSILIILGIGQLINISTGCSGLLLIMCGFGKIHSYISIVFTSLNIILNLFLIIKFGAIGAAIATSLSIALENITKVYFAKKKTGILTNYFLKFKI